MGAIYCDLAGKVALITGGASGIGEAIVRRFAQQRSIVVFFDIKIDEGNRLARELSGEGLSVHFDQAVRHCAHCQRDQARARRYACRGDRARAYKKSDRTPGHSERIERRRSRVVSQSPGSRSLRIKKLAAAVMAAMTAWAEDRRVAPVPKRKAYSRVHARRNFLFWNGPWVRDACMVTVRCVAIDR